MVVALVVEIKIVLAREARVQLSLVLPQRSI